MLKKNTKFATSKIPSAKLLYLCEKESQLLIFNKISLSVFWEALLITQNTNEAAKPPKAATTWLSVNALINSPTDINAPTISIKPIELPKNTIKSGEAPKI